MEDNAPEAAPQPCTAGCGFYGNKIYNNMCSKCFKEQDERNKKGDFYFILYTCFICIINQYKQTKC
jgi:hypothetical protein